MERLDEAPDAVDLGEATSVGRGGGRTNQSRAASNRSGSKMEQTAGGQQLNPPLPSPLFLNGDPGQRTTYQVAEDLGAVRLHVIRLAEDNKKARLLHDVMDHLQRRDTLPHNGFVCLEELDKHAEKYL